MKRQITLRVSEEEMKRIDDTMSVLAEQERYTVPRSATLRRLLAIACDVIQDSRAAA